MIEEDRRVINEFIESATMDEMVGWLITCAHEQANGCPPLFKNAFIMGYHMGLRDAVHVVNHEKMCEAMRLVFKEASLELQHLVGEGHHAN